MFSIRPENDPAARFHFELLAERHDVSAFTCRYTFIDGYLKEKALEETRRDMSRTFILLDRNAVNPMAAAGFFTLRADLLYHAREPYGQDIVPVAELAYLARHVTYRGIGLGALLLMEAMCCIPVECLFAC